MTHEHRERMILSSFSFDHYLRGVTIRQSLLALSAMTLPAAAYAQYAPWPAPPPPIAPPPAQRPVVAEPWMAQPQPPVQQPWSPASAPSRAPALEPIDLPPAIEQGVDMIYIDQELVPRAVHDNNGLADMNLAAWSGAPVDLFSSVNPIY